MKDIYLKKDTFIKKYNLDENLLNDIIEKNKKDYAINKDGILYIKESFIEIYKTVIDIKDAERKDNSIPNNGNDLIKVIENLNEQIREKDKMIFELQNKIISLVESAQNIANKSLELQEQRNYIEAHEKTEKKGFFRRLLNR